jgi:multiple sugar transport system permease protein
MTTIQLRAQHSILQIHSSTRKRIIQSLSLILCIALGFTYFFPFYWTLATALKTDQQVFQWPPTIFPPSPQWQNFVLATRYIPFWNYMLNTLIICALTVIGTLLSCTLIAYGFSRIQWKGRSVVFLVYLSSIMLPGAVTLIPLYVIFVKLNWVGTILPLVVPAFFGTPFYVFLLRQFFMTIPNDLPDAAKIDGANDLQIIWFIFLPLVKPALAVVALFTFLDSYRDFVGPLIYLGDQSQWTISLGLSMFKNMYGAEWQLMMAASILTMLPIIVLFFFAQKIFVEGITLTGIKG